MEVSPTTQQVAGVIQQPFFISGQCPEPIAIDFIENAVDLGAQILASSDIHLNRGDCFRHFWFFPEPTRKFNIAVGFRKPPAGLMDVSEVNPAGQHASEVRGMSDA